MKIGSIELNKFLNTNINEKQKNVNSKNPIVSNNRETMAYPKNYYVNFTARSTYEIYENYKDTEMPTTVREYIENLKQSIGKEKFTIFASNPNLYEIQHEAFKKLADCKTIEDIQRTFPNEKCFKNLKEATEISKTGKGLLNAISRKLNNGTKVFDLDEDLTVYLVKQLFLECLSQSDIAANLSELTLDEEIKEKISNLTLITNPMLSQLGIKAPNGNSYGKALLYSEGRKYGEDLSDAISGHWSELSPQKVTERIKEMLKGSEKKRYSMIDAWNKCIQTRQQLSDFLFNNFNNPQYNRLNSEDKTNAILSIYSGNFSEKLEKLMTDFWAQNPQAKIELSNQIKKSIQEYEEKMLEGENALKQHVQKIIEEQKSIENQLIKRRQIEHSFLNAKSMIQTIAQKSNKMYIKNDETNEDYYKILLKQFNPQELTIYEKSLTSSKPTKEFSAIYPPKVQIVSARKSLEYLNLINSQILSLIENGLEEGVIDRQTILDSMQDKTLFDDLIKSLTTTPKVLKRYSSLKSHVSKEKKEQVKETLLQITKESNPQLIQQIETFINTQGKYLTLINSSDETMNLLTALLTLNKLDEFMGTKYLETYIKELKNKEEENKKIDFIKNIDLSAFISDSWDV